MLLGLLVPVGAWLAFSAFASWFDLPIRRASRVAGIDIPSESRLVFHDDLSVGPKEEGFSLYVFDVPPGAGAVPNTPRDCAKLDYQYGPLKDLDTRLVNTDKYFDRNAEGCFKLANDAGYWELTILQGSRIVIEVIRG